MILRRLVAAFVATSMLAACSNSDSAEGTDGASDSSTTTAPAGKGQPDGPVQDLMTYERISTIDGDGAEVVLTDLISDHFDGEPDQSVALTDELTFLRYDDLEPQMLAGEEIRDDVEVIAGFIESDDGRVLAALATPDADSDRPIGFDDTVEIDLTFLEGTLAPGDPLLMDYGFIQSVPAGEAGGAPTRDGLQLLRQRFDDGGIRYLGDPESGQPQVNRNELGVATEGSIKGGLPVKSRAMMDGFVQGVENCEFGARANPMCVIEYFQDFGQGAKESLDLLNCNMNKSGCEVEPDPDAEPTTTTTTTTPKPQPTPSNRGRSTGDPHITTYDGHGFQMQGVGEFVATRSDDLEVQMRTATDGQSGWSRVTAVAARFGDTTVMISPEGVLVDGESVADRRLTEVIILDGAVLSERGNGVELRTDDGHLVWATFAGGYWMDLWVEVPLERTDWEGMYGDGDGDQTNDMITSDGVQLPLDLDFEQLYDVYAESWRVTDATSLFTYRDGDSTETFTDRSQPGTPTSIETLPAGERRRAEGLCRAAGLVEQVAIDECVFDFVLTGDISTVRTAMTADVYAGVRSGRLEASAVERRDLPELRSESGAGAPEEGGRPEGWLATGDDVRGTDATSTHSCPPSERIQVPIWGTDVYSSDSSVCVAAVHAGLIDFATGGEVRVEHQGPVDSFTASNRNGVRSSSWDSWPRSFVVLGQPPTGADPCIIDEDGHGPDCDEGARP